MAELITPVLINPHERTVTKREVDGSLQSYQALVGRHSEPAVAEPR
jgi:hypothetical protein